MLDNFTRDTWEIRLLRRVKSAIADGACKEAFELLTELVLSGGGGRVCVDDPSTNQRWQEHLAEKSKFVAMLRGIDCNLISVDAFDLARIDRLLHLAELRRENGIRKIAKHSRNEAARPSRYYPERIVDLAIAWTNLTVRRHTEKGPDAVVTVVDRDRGGGPVDHKRSWAPTIAFLHEDNRVVHALCPVL
jgi:hypothetical protein